jgi:ABC-type proline/glycine betaine transport system ATPase subunit
MVTHDQEEALSMADRVAVMRDGKIAQIGTPQQLAANPADDFVRTLIETPRRRARELAAIMQAGTA